MRRGLAMGFRLHRLQGCYNARTDPVFSDPVFSVFSTRALLRHVVSNLKLPPL